MSVNATWQLEDFVDSLVVELDKTRETLAVRAINKPTASRSSPRSQGRRVPRRSRSS